VTRTFHVLEDAVAVARETADRVVALGQEAIDRQGTFHFVLTGGSTPLMVCPLLVVPPRVRELDWTKVEFYFGDERAVPARHLESNYNTARTALLDHLPRLRPGQVHRMLGEAADLDAACHAYEALLRRVVPPSPDGLPMFDLVWLGMGSDGHTASLFPNTAAIHERDRLAVPNWVPKLDAWRLTLTYPILNAARQVDFVATGADKAQAVASVRSGRQEVPAAAVDAAMTTWIVDREAAGETDSATGEGTSGEPMPGQAASG
jgi:6-phosphogluconolactonase